MRGRTIFGKVLKVENPCLQDVVRETGRLENVPLRERRPPRTPGFKAFLEEREYWTGHSLHSRPNGTIPKAKLQPEEYSIP